MEKIKKFFAINREQPILFENRTEQFALIYEQHEKWTSSDFDDRGNWEYTEKEHIYEQVEFFNDIGTMEKRQKELSKITNKVYKNFICIHRIK